MDTQHKKEVVPQSFGEALCQPLVDILFNVLVVPDLSDDTIYFVQDRKVVGKIVDIDHA